MAVRKYTRVKDKATGHEYDVLSHRVNPDKHELVDAKRYPEVSRPRAPKPNVKGKRSAAPATEKPSAAKKTSVTAKPAAAAPAPASGGDPS